MVAAALAIAPGTGVHALQRLRRADGDPLAIETTYYSAELTPGLLERPLDGSFWAILRDGYGLSPSRAAATLAVVTPDESASRHLDARIAAPGFLVTRRTFEADGRCIEFALTRRDQCAARLGRSVPCRRCFVTRPGAGRRARPT